MTSAAFALGTGGAALAAKPFVPDGARQIVAPVVQGDEPIVVSEHRIQTTHGPLDYEARVGRLPIRSQQTGEVRGYIFFVAYAVKTKGPPRPVTFAWNGGPLVASEIIHMEGLGPRVRKGIGKDDAGGMIDNPETLLATSDLVFMDAMETGFSRPAKPEFAPEFFNLQGDVAATAEFIRSYQTRFGATRQPLIIAGESYGVFRAAALSDYMTERGTKIAGTILISGDIPNIPQKTAFYDAMHIPARAAAAYYYKRLPEDLMKEDQDTAVRQAFEWARDVYMPALEKIDTLDEAQRDRIAGTLARYTGIQPDQVDHKTLVVHAGRYLNIFFGGDGTRVPGEEDMRTLKDDPRNGLGSAAAIETYIRDELGYATNLTYNGFEKGYMPTPGHPALSPGEQFYYNQPGLTDEDWQLTRQDGEVTYIARDNPAWIVNAMKRDKTMDVFVATGRYDPLNMCEGDVLETQTLAPDLAGRISNHCYNSGHLVYRDPVARPLILHDLAAFVQKAIRDQPTAETANP